MLVIPNKKYGLSKLTQIGGTLWITYSSGMARVSLILMSFMLLLVAPRSTHAFDQEPVVRDKAAVWAKMSERFPPERYPDLHQMMSVLREVEEKKIRYSQGRRGSGSNLDCTKAVEIVFNQAFGLELEKELVREKKGSFTTMLLTRYFQTPSAFPTLNREFEVIPKSKLKTPTRLTPSHHGSEVPVHHYFEVLPGSVCFYNKKGVGHAFVVVDPEECIGFDVSSDHMGVSRYREEAGGKLESDASELITLSGCESGKVWDFNLAPGATKNHPLSGCMNHRKVALEQKLTPVPEAGAICNVPGRALPASTDSWIKEALRNSGRGI